MRARAFDRVAVAVDWPALLADIAYLIGDVDPVAPERRVACGQPRLAAYLGVSRETVRRWIDGSRVEWSDGETLLAVWVRLTGKSEEFAPRGLMPMSAARAGR